MSTKTPEGAVKELIKSWWAYHKGWFYFASSNGRGVSGIHDNVGFVPVEITPSMVGTIVPVFVSIEAKAPGRRNEAHRGMSGLQWMHYKDIIKAGGHAACVDGEEDLVELTKRIYK